MQLTDQPEPGVWAPISIHAPIKDATRMDLTPFDFTMDFNSRTHKGCDVIICLSMFAVQTFQFTHP